MPRRNLTAILYNIINSKSKTFLAFCFFFLGGVALASIINKRFEFIYFYFIWLTLGGSVIIFLYEELINKIKKRESVKIQRTHKIILLALFCLLFASAGYARYNFEIIEKTVDNINFYNGQTITFDANIIAEPDVREDKAIYILQASSVQDGQKKIPSSGKVYLDLSPQPKYSYGDNLIVNCTLKDPKEVDSQFAMYLATKNIAAVCWSPELRLNNSGAGNIITGWILSLKNTVDTQVRQLWHEPYASFMAGILYGYKGGLGKAGDMFKKTGTTHILAVSGQNISIIANVFIAACVYLLIPRKRAYFLICAGIILFVMFTGASSSAIRAGVMATLVLTAKQSGRLGKSINLLIFTAAFMVAQNPFILFWDVGFQLSFFATLGIVIFNPIISQQLKNIQGFDFLKEAFTTTASATIFTLPIILYSFGLLSVVSIFVNMLILWIIPLLMLTGFISIIAGLVYFPLGNIVAWLPWFGMKYVFLVTKFFADLKFSAISFQLPLAAMLTIYLVIFYFTRKLRSQI